MGFFLWTSFDHILPDLHAARRNFDVPPMGQTWDNIIDMSWVKWSQQAQLHVLCVGRVTYLEYPVDWRLVSTDFLHMHSFFPSSFPIVAPLLSLPRMIKKKNKFPLLSAAAIHSRRKRRRKRRKKRRRARKRRKKRRRRTRKRRWRKRRKKRRTRKRRWKRRKKRRTRKTRWRRRKRKRRKKRSRRKEKKWLTPRWSPHDYHPITTLVESSVFFFHSRFPQERFLKNCQLCFFLLLLLLLFLLLLLLLLIQCQCLK